jgi:hypothetical protein
MFKNCIIGLVAGVLLFFSAQLLAQESKKDSICKPEKPDKENVTHESQNLIGLPCTSPFVELMGKGFISVNVDFRRSKSYAISLGLQPTEGLLPDVMFYYFSGKRYRMETGGGFSVGFDKNLKPAAVLFHGVIGYRYQQKDGLFFRAGFTPLYVILFNNKEMSNKLYPFVGLSLGYCF